MTKVFVRLLQFVVWLGFCLEAQIVHGLCLLERVRRIVVMCPADVKQCTLGADATLVQHLVQVQRVCLEINLRMNRKNSEPN